MLVDFPLLYLLTPSLLIPGIFGQNLQNLKSAYLVHQLKQSLLHDFPGYRVAFFHPFPLFFFTKLSSTSTGAPTFFESLSASSQSSRSSSNSLLTYFTPSLQVFELHHQVFIIHKLNLFPWGLLPCSTIDAVQTLFLPSQKSFYLEIEQFWLWLTAAIQVRLVHSLT